MQPLNFILNAATQCYTECSHSTLHLIQPLKILSEATQLYIECSHSELFWLHLLEYWVAAFSIPLRCCTIYVGSLLYSYYSGNITLLMITKAIERRGS